MKRIALTGGIATGKSYVLRAFAALGVPTLDADLVARAVVEPGEPAALALRSRFGDEVFQTDGTLDRSRLAAVVFRDTVARRDLEAIVHPPVRERITRWQAAREEDGAAFAIVAIPLLFETGRERDFKGVIVTTCADGTQRDRLVARGLSDTQVNERLAAQLPSARKEKGADYVIRTDDTHAETDRQVRKIYEVLTESATGRP